MTKKLEQNPSSSENLDKQNPAGREEILREILKHSRLNYNYMNSSNTILSRKKKYPPSTVRGAQLGWTQ